MKLSELFKNCYSGISYEQVGDGVNYAFVEDKERLYIYFQGSSQISDWVRNFLFKRRPYKDMEVPYKVHRGFLAAWKEVKDIIIAKITEKDNDNSYKWKEIIIVGYSHGGSLAALCHECTWFYREDLRDSGIYGYAFEAPKMYGGFKVKKELKNRWNHFFIFRTNHDIVTYCPPWIFGYCHVGTIIKIQGDTKLVNNKLPKCIKSHFPEVVYDALVNFENKL